MMKHLEHLDERLFLFINGAHNDLFDFIMYWASDTWFWAPLYACLLIYFYIRFRKTAIYYFICIILLVVLTDQLSSHVIKEIARRPRPSHVPALAAVIRLSEAGSGGLYGFTSSHAANTFGLAFFLVFTLPPSYWWLKGGMLMGAGAAWCMAKLFRKFLGDWLLFIHRRMVKQ